MALINNNLPFFAYYGSIFFHLYLLANPALFLNTPLIRVVSQFLSTLMIAHKVHNKDAATALNISNGLTISAVAVSYMANEERNPSYFMIGLAISLLAHMYYAIGLNHSLKEQKLMASEDVKKSKSSWSYWIIPMTTYVGVLSVIVYFILPSTSFEWKIPLILYGTTVATVIWKGIDASLATDHAESGLAVLVLGISDFILAYSKFVEPIKNNQLIFMLTYYLAQTLIAKFALK
ncbi:YhhN-like protein-domain-containing protein [Globomyces pollinis-pini]|nr:YhhN-like protein-domain-containing protein [Globomyces pollinis-pini]